MQRAGIELRDMSLDELLDQWDENPIQVLLGLPEVNVKETRRKLFKVFAAYRRFKRQLESGEGFDVIRVTRKSKPGYEDAEDPDLIRAPYSTGHGRIGDTPHLRRIESFIDTLESKVRRLPELQREIIKRRYMALTEYLPLDIDVYMQLREKRLVMSERDYDRKKRESLLTLAESLDVMVFKIPE